MSEEKKPAEQLDAAQTEQELARKRNAFLRYMTIVFAVAFLLVLVSLVLQMHTAKAAMSDLKESNSSALTNAAANAELLQDDNRKLQEQVDALTAELAEADEARSAQAERIAALAPYQVNAALMAKADPNAIFMHCLPAYHDKKTAVGSEMCTRFGREAMEVTDDVFESAQSVVFQEAENRMHTIKAVMAATLAEIEL